MAEGPTDIASSIAPANYKAKEVAKEREANRAATAHTAERGVKNIADRGATIDTEDGDTAIFADAEGTGSQGRPFEEDTQPEEEAESETIPEGITRDEDGQFHLDLEV